VDTGTGDHNGNGEVGDHGSLVSEGDFLTGDAELGPGRTYDYYQVAPDSLVLTIRGWVTIRCKIPEP
jgi:hypothetical protein